MVNHFDKMRIKALEMPTSCHPTISSLLKTLLQILLCPGNCDLLTGREFEGSKVQEGRRLLSNRTHVFGQIRQGDRAWIPLEVQAALGQVSADP